VGLRQEVRLPRPRTTCRSGSFDLTSGPGGPAVFQRQDGIGRRLLGKGRRVRRVIPAWRGQRTATNQNGRRPSWTAWGALSLTAAGAVHRKTNICVWGFSGAGNRPLAAPAPLLECRSPAISRRSEFFSIAAVQPGPFSIPAIQSAPPDLLPDPVSPWLQNLVTKRSPGTITVSFPREGLITCKSTPTVSPGVTAKL